MARRLVTYRMSIMHSPPPHSRTPGAEPGAATLFTLFFGSLIAAGLIGLWLWNSNPSVREGRAFGTPNQLSPGGLVGGPASGTTPSGSPQAGSGADPALVARGQQLAAQFACAACHSTTGQQGAGPTWKGLAGSQRTLDNGQTVTADDEYLRQSILQPDAQIVTGFSRGTMSGAVAAFSSQLQQPDNVDALIAYIKSLQ